jgi:simple sugar transport system permease protein
VAAGGVALLADKTTGRWIVLAILLAGVLGGMAWAGITALLRDRFNANEILVSLMLVYVAEHGAGLPGLRPVEGPGMGYNFPQTKTFDAVTQIPRLMQGSRVSIGLLLALAGAAARCGCSCSAPRRALPSRWAGWRRQRRATRAFRRAGAVDGAADFGRAAGLAGALEVAGPLGQLTPYVPAGYGFAAIIVAFVGRLHPVGMVFSAILMSMFYIGGELAQSRLGLPKSLTGVFQGLLLFTLLACDTLDPYRMRWVAGPPGGAVMESYALALAATLNAGTVLAIAAWAC